MLREPGASAHGLDALAVRPGVEGSVATWLRPPAMAWSRIDAMTVAATRMMSPRRAL